MSKAPRAPRRQGRADDDPDPCQTAARLLVPAVMRLEVLEEQIGYTVTAADPDGARLRSGLGASIEYIEAARAGLRAAAHATRHAAELGDVTDLLEAALSAARAAGCGADGIASDLATARARITSLQEQLRHGRPAE